MVKSNGCILPSFRERRLPCITIDAIYYYETLMQNCSRATPSGLSSTASNMSGFMCLIDAIDAV